MALVVLKHRIITVVLLLAATSTSFAQSCAEPISLLTQSYFSIDTCNSGDPDPGDLCDAVATTGNALFFRARLAYPVYYYLSVSPGTGVNFNPAIFVRRHDQACAGGGSCVTVIDMGGTGASESFQLTALDSGDYDIIVTSIDPGAPCGSAIVTFAELTFGEPPPSDGIFISRFEY